jgi:hypothetical protein
MTAALAQALRRHVGRLAREIGERLAQQRGDPPVIVLHPIWHWILADRKACATFGAFDLGQWDPHIPPIA